MVIINIISISSITSTNASPTQTQRPPVTPRQKVAKTHRPCQASFRYLPLALKLHKCMHARMHDAHKHTSIHTSIHQSMPTYPSTYLPAYMRLHALQCFTDCFVLIFRRCEDQKLETDRAVWVQESQILTM